MDLYGQKSKSIPQKIVIHALEAVFLWLSWWILFGSGGQWTEQHLHIHNVCITARREIIFVFNVVIFARIAYTMFFLVKRRIPWGESIDVPFAFALYYIGYTLLTLPRTHAIDGADYFAIGLFIIGCVLNTAGETLRDIWKKRPENQGKLYTGGFFKYSRHINYFGDLLWVTAYAIITRNWYASAIPVFLFCFFAFYNAPKLDKYLRSKYGHDFEEYAKNTKMLIPFIY